MAKAHSFLWRLSSRRDEERRKFAKLMRKVEALRLRLGMNKTDLASELETTTDALRAWMTGRTIGRKETVAQNRSVHSAENSIVLAIAVRHTYRFLFPRVSPSESHSRPVSLNSRSSTYRVCSLVITCAAVSHFSASYGGGGRHGGDGR